MPQLKQFQALGDAAGWCVIGLDMEGALWYGMSSVEPPTQPGSGFGPRPMRRR
jgi:hypothetical protein